MQMLHEGHCGMIRMKAIVQVVCRLHTDLLGHLKIECFWLLLIHIPSGWMSFTIIYELRKLGEGKGCLLEVTVKKMVI